MTAMSEADSGHSTIGPRSLLVTGIAEDAIGVRLVTLMDPNAQPLAPWQPGDHIDIELAPGLTRPYSLCGDPCTSDSWTIAVRLAQPSTGGSDYVHTTLQQGDTVRVASPRRRFPLEDAPHIILIAGGIGLTPIITMAEHLQRMGASFELIVFCRGVDRLPFRERLARLGASARIVDRSTSRESATEAIVSRPAGSLIFACGPEALLRSLREVVGDGSLRLETFESATPEPPLDQPCGVTTMEDAAFDVEMARSGRVIIIPADRPMLDVLLEAGADILWSCREGNCASCEVSVLGGVPDHRDVILTDDERAAGDCMFPCVSRARGQRLTIDI